VKWRVAIRPRAETDLRQARNWYENKRAGLGDEFLAEIGITLELLARNPERHPDYYRGFRRVLTRRFPYKDVLQAGRQPGHCVSRSTRAPRSSPSTPGRKLVGEGKAKTKRPTLNFQRPMGGRCQKSEVIRLRQGYGATRRSEGRDQEGSGTSQPPASNSKL
jgi:hypothetical protein